MSHRLSKPRNISPIGSEIMKARLRSMVDERNELISTGKVKDLHVFISGGNGKVGATPSVSLIPVADCKNCAACSKLCYDLRNDCMYKTVAHTRAVNSAIFWSDIDRFFKEINSWLFENEPTHFRWNVGSDVNHMLQFKCIVVLALTHEETQFLLFTKSDDIVNGWLQWKDEPDHDECIVRKIPSNLHIIFSNWVGQELDNPFNFPTSNPLFSDETMRKMGYEVNTTAHPGAFYCTGNCTECFDGCGTFEDPLVQWHGCWQLKPGQEVVFPAH